MSRIIPFPLASGPSPVPFESVTFDVEEDLDKVADGYGQPDPSTWGVPRVFYLVRAAAERPADTDVAC